MFGLENRSQRLMMCPELRNTMLSDAREAGPADPGLLGTGEGGGMPPTPEPYAFHNAVDDLQRALRGQRARRVEQTDDLGEPSGLVIDVASDRAPARRQE